MTIYTDKRLLRTGLIGGTFSRHSGNMREVACQNAALVVCLFFYGMIPGVMPPWPIVVGAA